MFFKITSNYTKNYITFYRALILMIVWITLNSCYLKSLQRSWGEFWSNYPNISSKSLPPLYPHPNNLPEINVLSYHVYKDQTYAHHQCIPFSKSQINKRRILINLKALTLKSSINLDSREIPVEQNDSTYNSSGTESNDHSLKQNQIFSFASSRERRWQ